MGKKKNGRAKMDSRLKRKDLKKMVRAEVDSRLKSEDLKKKGRAEMNSRLEREDLKKEVRAAMDSRIKKEDLEKKVRAAMNSRLKNEDLKKAAEMDEARAEEGEGNEQPESEQQPIFQNPDRQGELTSEGKGLIQDAMRNNKLVRGRTVIIAHNVV